jgi:hypothetical protein
MSKINVANFAFCLIDSERLHHRELLDDHFELRRITLMPIQSSAGGCPRLCKAALDLEQLSVAETTMNHFVLLELQNLAAALCLLCSGRNSNLH